MSEQINSATKFLASAAAEALIDGVHSVGVTASPGLTDSVGQSGQPEIASITDTEIIEKFLIAQPSGSQLPATFAEASDVLVKRLADKSLLRMVNRLAKEQFQLETIFAMRAKNYPPTPAGRAVARLTAVGLNASSFTRQRSTRTRSSTFWQRP